MNRELVKLGCIWFLSELNEANAINRSVPAMPTGMEKEEESEKHLQDILVTFLLLFPFRLFSE